VFSESRQEDSPIYESLMRITVTTEKGKRSFAGTVQAARRVWSRSRAWTSTRPFSPRMLYVNNLDKPGFIGALGAAGRGGRQHRHLQPGPQENVSPKPPCAGFGYRQSLNWLDGNGAWA
jgi:hypothetical protein